MLKDALRWIIARSVMVAGAVLMILAFIVFATNMPNRSFLTMTLTQWGYVVGGLAAMFIGFALFFSAATSASRARSGPDSIRSGAVCGCSSGLRCFWAGSFCSRPAG